MIRTQTLLFGADDRPATLLLVLAGLTMVIGILGAIAQDDVKRILSFNIVSHIGYMVMGLALVLRRRASPPRSSTRCTTSSRRRRCS